MSSSKEIITFRKALLNPVTSLQFRRYVSIKGDTLENNVLFWLEVQKFKVSFDLFRGEIRIKLKQMILIHCCLSIPVKVPKIYMSNQFRTFIMLTMTTT